MNKTLSVFVFLLLGLTAYLAFAFNQISQENAVLTKQLVEKEQDYSWLERELQTTKRELDKIIRSQASVINRSQQTVFQENTSTASANSKKSSQTQKVQAKHKNAQQLMDSERQNTNGR